jgi:hypothetical protein
MSSLTIVVQGFERPASVAREIQRRFQTNGLSVKLLPMDSAPDDFRLSPTDATIVVAGIGALSAVVISLVAFISSRGSGHVVIVGTNGRRIEFPKATPRDQVSEYIAIATELENTEGIKHVILSNRS